MKKGSLVKAIAILVALVVVVVLGVTVKGSAMTDCTDCEGGGARMMIRNGENGLLTPIGDKQAMYEAMKKLVENPAYAACLGCEAAKIRHELSIEKIADRWETMIG